MSHCEHLPNGAVVRVTGPLSPEERAALTEFLDGLAAAAQDHWEARRAALSPEERAAEDDRARTMAARSAARLDRLRGLRD